MIKKNETNFEIKEYNILYDNFIRFMNYMEKIRENINGKLLNNFKFIIELNSIQLKIHIIIQLKKLNLNLYMIMKILMGIKSMKMIIF